MSEATNESLEWCIVNDRYIPKHSEVIILAQQLLDIKLNKTEIKKNYPILEIVFGVIVFSIIAGSIIIGAYVLQ